MERKGEQDEISVREEGKWVFELYRRKKDTPKSK